MLNSGAKPTRSWQDIIADAGKERSPEKLAELSKELERALDWRKKTSHMTAKPASPARSKRK
jgi:hypothetical protein